MKNLIGMVAACIVVLGSMTASAQLSVVKIGLEKTLTGNSENWAYEYNSGGKILSGAACVDSTNSNCGQMYYSIGSVHQNFATNVDKVMVAWENNNSDWYTGSKMNWNYALTEDANIWTQAQGCYWTGWTEQPSFEYHTRWTLGTSIPYGAGQQADHSSFYSWLKLSSFIENEDYDACNSYNAMNPVAFAEVVYRYNSSTTKFARQFGVYI
jgi:hypothetical protein